MGWGGLSMQCRTGKGSLRVLLRAGCVPGAVLTLLSCCHSGVAVTSAGSQQVTTAGELHSSPSGDDQIHLGVSPVLHLVMQICPWVLRVVMTRGSIGKSSWWGDWLSCCLGSCSSNVQTMNVRMFLNEYFKIENSKDVHFAFILLGFSSSLNNLITSESIFFL